MKRVVVIGAGWLGLPLAQWLKQQGHIVYATRTTPQGLQTLQPKGIQRYILKFQKIQCDNGCS